jgi:phage-related protein
VKATGGAANVSAKQVNALAQSLEGQTATQAESIQQGANLLLTFRGIRNEAGKGNDIFNQTTAAAVDMARAMGTDVTSSAMMLGKALNDPAAGMTKLTRSGVTFTAQQQAQVKALTASGNKLAAQKIILAELNGEFGGSGVAYAKTYEGALYRLGDAVGDFGEKIATAAMPAITGLVNTGANIANWATNSGVIEKSATAIGSAFTTVKTGVGAFVTGLNLSQAAAQSVQGPLTGLTAVGFLVRQTLTGIGTAIGPAMATVGASIATTVGGIVAAVGPLMPPLIAAFQALIPPVLALLPALSPVGLIFQALLPVLPQIAGLIAQLATVIGGALGQAAAVVVPIIATLVSTMSGVWVSIMPTIVQLVTALAGAIAVLAPVILGVVSALAPLVVALVSQLAPVFVQLVTSVLPPLITIFSAIVAAIAPLITMIAGLLIPVIQALLPVVTAVFGALVPIISAALQIVQGVIQVVLGIITGNWSQAWSGLKGIVSGVWNLIVGVIRGAIGIVSSVISAAIGVIVAIWTSGWRAVGSAVSTGINNVVGLVRGLGGTISGIVGGFGSLLFSAGQAVIQGFIDGIKGMVGAVGDAVGGVMDFVKGFFPHSPAKRGPFSGAGWTAVGKSGAALADQFTAGFNTNAEINPTFGGGKVARVSSRPSLPAAVGGAGGGQLTGNLYLDSGELLGIVQGHVQQQAALGAQTMRMGAMNRGLLASGA